MKIEHVLFPSVFIKITYPFDGRSFLMCSHDPFFGTNKNRILKNGLCEWALRKFCHEKEVLPPERKFCRERESFATRKKVLPW